MRELLVNLKPLFSSFLWTKFEEYLDNEIAIRHLGLEIAPDQTSVAVLQGEVRALRKIKKLREAMNAQS